MRNGKYYRLFAQLCLICCLLVVGNTTLLSQSFLDQQTDIDSIDEAKALLKKLDEDQSLKEEEKSQLESIHQALDEVEKLEAKLKNYRAIIASTPQQMERVKQELAEDDPEPVVLEEKTISELEQELSITMAQLTDAQDLLLKLEGEPQKRVSRRMKIPDEISQIQQMDFSGSDESIDIDLIGDDETNKVTSLLQWTSKRLRGVKVEVLDAELDSYEARSRLLPLRRDLSARQVEQFSSQANQLRKALESSRRVEAEQTAQTVRMVETTVHPELVELASENTRLAEIRSGEAGVLDEIIRLDEKLHALDVEKRRLQIRFEELKEKVDVVGLTNATGLLLQKEVGELPNLSQHQQEIHLRKTLIPDVHLKIIELEGERDRLADGMNGRIDHLFQEISSPEAPLEAQQLEADIRDLFTKRLELYDSLLTDYDSYFFRLVELDTKQRQMVDLVIAFVDYVDRRMLWVRGPSPLSLEMVGNFFQGVLWFFSPGNWKSVGQVLFKQAVQSPLRNILITVLFIAIYIFQGKLKAKLKLYSKEIQVKRNVQFFPTLKALAITLILLMPVPVVCIFISNALQAVSVNHPFPSYLASGLVAAMYIFVPLNLMCQVCRRDGLGEAHFQWSTAAMRALHKKLFLVTPIITIMAVVVYSVTLHTNISWRIAAGAWVSILIQTGVALLIYWALDLKGVVLRGFFMEEKQRTLNHVRLFWRPLLAGFPLVLVLLGLFGWTFGSMALSTRYIYTLLLLMIVIILRSLFIGWIRIQYRQIKIREAYKRLEKIRSERTGASSSSRSVDQIEKDELDMDAADRQLRRLMDIVSVVIILIGLRALWDNVLPALKRFDTIYLWERTVSLSDFIDTSSGTTALTNQVVSQAYVTLNDLIMATVIFAITFTAAKNLPGMVDVMILRRFSIDAGVQFAITTFYRYTLVMVGVIVGCSILGIGWSKVQWLAAAVSVGLGFGLQEIFANFVSGMIILIERPIRLGDIVTVGETSGTVTQIRMRATVITDWDRLELLVPNKEFVTGRLINWTLTDPMTRMHIDVGVAYGSDTEKARAIMQEIAESHPAVADDPKPMTVFVDFGDSSLLLRLYVHLPDRSLYLATITDLRTEIDKRFKEANIVIAFPQLDVHLDRVTNNDQS